MKKKFILFSLLLLTLIGGVKFNVLNAQEQYRIKIVYNTPANGVGEGQYLHIHNHDEHQGGAKGGVGINEFAESDSQIFTMEDAGGGMFYLRSANNYYIYCQEWNVDAYSTYSFYATKLSKEDLSNGTFYLKNGSSYFKIGKVDGEDAYAAYGDAGLDLAAIFALEQVITDDGIKPAAPTNLQATANDHKSISLTWEAGDANALRYNIYQAGVKIGSTSETSYTVNDLAAETNYCFTVEAVRGVNVSESHSNEACATTAVAPKTQKIIFVMGDSYGNGWNGAYMTVVANDGTNEKIEFASGETLTKEIEICVGAEVTITYEKSSNSWPGENSFDIKYEDGEVIWSKAKGSLSATISHTFTVKFTEPSIEVNYASLDFDDVRVGGDFWTEKGTSFDVEVTAKNTEIKAISIDDAFFTSDKDFSAAAGQTEFNFTVSYDKNADAGEKSGNIVVTYMNGEDEATAEIPMSATAYIPVQGDAIENPIEVSFDENGSYSNTPTTFTNMHDDYILPNETWNEGNNTDVVYKLVLDDKALVTAEVNVGSWMAVYDEDFSGVGGPKADNAIATGLNNTVLSDGTYYVLLATNGTFTLTMTKMSVPAPTISYSNPYNESINNDNPMLQWDMQYAEEYQLLFGTDAENLDVLVDWTEELEYSYQTSELPKNTEYYWQVNAKNITGTTTGEVWSFVTLLDCPQDLMVEPSSELYPGDYPTFSWSEVAGAIGYNLYINGEMVEGPIEANTYMWESELPYNMNPGHEIAVTAVHELGESPKCDPTFVQVAGSFPLKVNVKDSNNNPIVGATVTFNTSYALDEFKNDITAPEAIITNAEGVAETILPLMYDDPNAFGEQILVYADKAPFIQKWASITPSGLSNGVTKEVTINLSLPTPSNLYPEGGETMFLEGDNLTLNWTAADGAIGYNVYKRGEYNNSTYTYEYELLGSVTENTCTTVAEHDSEGSYYAVSAVFEGDLESEKTLTYDRIYVLGTGDVTGVVKDQDGNPVAGAALLLSGTTGFGEDLHISETETDGTFLIEDVIEGTYSLTVSHNDYQAAEPLSNIEVVYNSLYDLETITLTEKPEITGVTVTADNNGNVSWTGDYAKYNVYRRNIETPQELETVATELEANSTTDAQWETLEAGTYQYGVAAFAEGGTEIGVQLSENFDDGVIPEGWNVIKAVYSGYWGNTDWYWYVNNGTAYSTYAEGDITTYLVTPLVNTKNATLQFDHINPYDSWGKNVLYVRYSTSQDGPWSDDYLYCAEYSGSYQTVALDLSVIKEEQVYIAFCNTNSEYGGNGIRIDNITITGEVASEVETKLVWSNEVVKQGPATFVGTQDAYWDNPNNWSTGEIPAAGAEVTIAANAAIAYGNINVSNLTIKEGVTLTIANTTSLTVTGTITQEDDHSLVINDGAQVFQSNENVTAKFIMKIDNPTEWSANNKDGWQFISMPFTDAEYGDFANRYNSSTEQYTCDYDLYKYDGAQDLEWQNYKEGDWTEEQFISGTGYLASRKEVETVAMYGTLNNAASKVWGQYGVNNEKVFANFKLLGNPFAFDMDMTKLNSYGTMAEGYAVVNQNGEYEYKTDGTVKVGDGFFVKVLTNYAQLNYNHNAKSTRSASNNSLNIVATGNAGKDNVVVSFGGKSEGFNKLQNFNDDIATVYVAENGNNYGIYNCDADVQEIELCFNANQMGNYTISIEPNGKFQSVTLVDRFTGVETNMLLEDYNFTAMSNVNNNRFIVKLVNGQQSTDNSHFAYVSGEDLIIEAEGAVEIIDMMGRVIYASEVESTNNRINVSAFDNAAYLIRVVNENEVKVQKIIL